MIRPITILGSLLAIATAGSFLFYPGATIALSVACMVVSGVAIIIEKKG